MDKGLSLAEIHDFFIGYGFPELLRKSGFEFRDIVRIRIIDLRSNKTVFRYVSGRDTLLPDLKFELSRMTDTTTKNFQVVIETETREFRL